MSSPKCPFSLYVIIIIATCHFWNKIINSERILSPNQDWGMVWAFTFFISTPGMIDCWIYLWALNFLLLIWLINNNINDIQVFKIFKSYTDTTGPFTIPFITCLQDMDLEVKCLHTDQYNSYASFIKVFVWIDTKQAVRTNVKKTCLLQVIGVLGAPPFSSADRKYSHWTLTNRFTCFLK